MRTTTTAAALRMEGAGRGQRLCLCAGKREDSRGNNQGSGIVQILNARSQEVGSWEEGAEMEEGGSGSRAAVAELGVSTH